jgi:hypothetical protein
MNDDLPEIFEHVHPRPAPARLRREVLSAVERELSRPRKPRWEQALELSAVACFLLGVGLTAWQWESEGPWQRLAATEPKAASGAWYADRPAFGDDRLADFVNRRLAARPPRHDAPPPFAADYKKLLAELNERPAG